MSRTWSELIVENFVINEGPKWDKFKRGAKKVGRGVATAAVVGTLALNANAAQKAADNNKIAFIQHTEDSRRANQASQDNDGQSWYAADKGDYETAYDYSVISRNNAKIAADAKEKADKANKQAKKQQIESHVSSAGAGAAAGAAALLALKKGKKKKQENKSLKENLNMVKSEMLLNEAVILAALAATIGSLGLVSLLTGSLAKLAIKM